jgi:signal transduction histidine kinase
VPLRTAAGFAAAIVAILLASAVYFVVIGERDARARRVGQASAALLSLERLDAALARAESAQRGYLLTRDARHRERFAAATRDVAVELDGVLSAGEGSSRAADAGAELAVLVDARLAGLASGLGTARIDAPAETPRLPGSDGLELSDRIAAARRVYAAAADAALHRERRAWFGRVALADAVFVLANAVLLALIGGAASSVRRELRAGERRRLEAARVVEVQERILGIASHDLRNPLSAVQLGARLLSRGGLPAAQVRIAERIGSCARRMEGIVRDLLDCTRVRAGRGIPVAVRPADLGEVCARAVDPLRAMHGEGAVILSCEGDLSGAWDADRLEQAVENLVSNALRYAPPGAPVRVRAGEDGHGVRVEVENDGPPIPPDVLRKIFDPFERGARDVDGPQGLGLGLFIVRSVVEAHGGTVAAVSPPGGPVTFTIALPRAVPLDETPPRAFRPSGRRSA